MNHPGYAAFIYPAIHSFWLYLLQLLAKAVGGERRLHRITTRDIERFRARRLATGLAASTANKEVRALRRIFSLAVLRGYLPQGQNPCVGLPMLRVAAKRPPYVSPEEFERIYGQAVDTLWRTLLVVLYTTGLRYREAMNLLWRDVDFESSQVHVTRRSAEGMVQAWTPKDQEKRSIPLPQQAVSLLATWQAIAPEGCPYVIMERGRWDYYRDMVKANKWRGGQDLVNNVLRRFQTLCRRAGAGPYTLHDLRRSCITNWAKRLPIHVVQQLAGHSDIQTTQRYYLSVQPADVAEAQALQAELLERIPKADLTDPKLTHFARKRAFPGQTAGKAIS